MTNNEKARSCRQRLEGQFPDLPWTNAWHNLVEAAWFDGNTAALRDERRKRKTPEELSIEMCGDADGQGGIGMPR